LVERAFDSFVVGETSSFGKTITAADIETFAELSGDRNPLHVDESYAATTRFKTRVSHGLLVASPISTLAGEYIPGVRCLLLEVSSRFLLPVFPGDQLSYLATISQISPATKVLKVRVDVTNQKGNAVLRGSYTAQLLPEIDDPETL